jgi:hypothetical protein
MARNSLSSSQINQLIFNFSEKHLSIQTVQEKIYNFLIEIVQKWEPRDVLQEFKRLFIDCLNSKTFSSSLTIYDFFSEDNEQEFRNTLKRCCYILINNWESHRKPKQKYIQELITILTNSQNIGEHNDCLKINIFKKWLENFVDSSDYQHLKLFAYRSEEQNQHWSYRYTSYLLVGQSLDKNNPKEQQEAAFKLSRKLKDKYKFELAMYIARSQSRASSSKFYKNPSVLGDEVLRLIKAIVVKKGVFSYENIANIFIKQTKNQNFQDFKESLIKYLFFSVQEPKAVENLKQQLTGKLFSWKSEYQEEIIEEKLLLRTCNRVIDFLTTENRKEPSQIFILLLSQGHALTLVIILLKIILICRNARSHLESRIAYLIRYYEQYPEEECQWVIHFMEIFNITFAIYAENVEYNLIKMKEDKEHSNRQLNPNEYLVFSQVKGKAKQ